MGLFTGILSVLLIGTRVDAFPLATRTGSPTDADILNFALTLEHLESAFYTRGLANYNQYDFQSNHFPDFTRGRFTQIAAHEKTHVEFLTTALNASGAVPVAACEYSFPDTDAASFVAMSEILESVGSSAYTGAAMFLSNKAYLTAAASILSIEARHAAWINSAVRKLNPWSTAFETPLDLNQVYTLASTFIRSCPSTNPALPVTAFPPLALPSNPFPGQNIGLNFTTPSSTSGEQLYAVFLSGLGAEFVPINGNNEVTVPRDLIGTVFVIVTDNNTSTSDDVTIAGPAVVQFSFNSWGQVVA